MSSLKTLLVATCLLSWAGGALAQADQHFHPKGRTRATNDVGMSTGERSIG